MCRNLDALGALFAGIVAFSLYEIYPLAPFLMTGSISVTVFVMFLTGAVEKVMFVGLQLAKVVTIVCVCMFSFVKKCAKNMYLEPSSHI